MVEPAGSRRVRVNARMPVDELNDVLHAELPEGDWDTVGGLLLDLLGPRARRRRARRRRRLGPHRRPGPGRRINRLVVEPDRCLLPWAEPDEGDEEDEDR